MRFIYRVFPAIVLAPALAAGACNNSNNSGSDAGPSAATEAGTPDTGATIPDAAAPPPAAGGTGAFGIVTVNGKQKMYLPQTTANAAGHAILAVVDVGVVGNGAAGAPALITTIDLGDADSGFAFEYATATGGDSSMVIAVSTDFPKVWFIDPTKDQVINTLTLDATYGSSSFSGGGGFVTGVAIDSANHRAILSVWNGFALVDLTTQTITSVIQAPPSENFGFDSAHQRIIAPFYDCMDSTLVTQTPSSCTTPKGPDGTTVMTDGLSIIDLADGNTVYTYENPAVDGGDLDIDPDAPVGTEPDSAAANPSTGVIVIPSEGSGFQSVIDLSKATFDKSTKTVTAPQNIIPGLGLTGVAIEYTRHLAFWEEEHGQDVAVADLTLANAGTPTWVHGLVPDLPGDAGDSFGNLGDPHGIAVTTSLTSSGPVGFVVDSGLQWVVRIDLAKMVAAEQSDASDTELDATAMEPFVTYLDAQTME